MKEKVLQYLLTNKDYLLVGEEIPFLSRCIDIVVLNKNEEIISIELKIKDWKHAIKQAANHKLGSDYAYICLPKRKLTEVLEKSICEAKVGLMMYNEESKNPIEVIIEAPHNNNQPIFKEIMAKTLLACTSKNIKKREHK
ncbi:MAG: hypothetical protein VZQ61_03470 [Christensenellaceae bacterium]